MQIKNRYLHFKVIAKQHFTQDLSAINNSIEIIAYRYYLQPLPHLLSLMIGQGKPDVGIGNIISKGILKWF